MQTFDELYQEAYSIAVVGASNPIAVAGTLHEAMLFLSRKGFDHSDIKESAAIRAIAAHLNFLLGQGLGPEESDLGFLMTWREELESRKAEE
jgi:hypothetical protein